MGLLDKLKQLLASGQPRAACEGPAKSHEGDACEEIPFSTAKAGPTESEKQERIAQLTPREYDLYLLLLEGFTLKESAERLLIKYSTANTHMSGVYRKLGVKSRAQLIINYRYVSIENTRSPM